MRNFADVKRIVIKIGTNTLALKNNIDTEFVKDFARQVNDLYTMGKQLVIVTSGAIGMGSGHLKIAKKVKKVSMQQACAAIGQPLLMHEYHKAFAPYNISVAQVLLTTDVFNHRTTSVNLKNSIETLLHLGVIPILNENDSVSTEEIGTAFGDNDKLSAFVASKIDANLLIMLTDIDALYDNNPKTHKDAQPIPVVYKITKALEQSAGGSGSLFSKGGMKTKLAAAKIIITAGCRMVLVHGREKNILTRVLAGEEIGTLFLSRERLSSRSRWILHAEPAGVITIDEGAMEAIKQSKSLLPKGIVNVEGVFKAGTVVMLNSIAKAVTNMSSDELNLISGKHSTEIRQLLGRERRDVVAVPEDIIFLDM
ncbi:MAG: glutamate 5-kinase [Spirochaetales bacterium]|nr:glutamate 5-kinase [Spirochaetales bacterium]